MSRELMLRMQQGLLENGFDPGIPDGVFGPKTYAAVHWLMAGYNELRAGTSIAEPEKPLAEASPFNEDWFPPRAAVKRGVLHWTGGRHDPNPVDLAAYHFVVDGTGKVHRGKYSLSDNVPPLGAGRYAAHAGGFNSYTAGIALCGMAGAKELPLSYGNFPINEGQWEAAAELMAQICRRYTISVDPDKVVTHAEVLPRWGVGIYKWDLTVLPWDRAISGHKVVGDRWRAAVALALG